MKITKLMISPLKLFSVLLGLSLLSACNTLKVTDDPNTHITRDPWQGFNRGVYSFNNTLDKAILKPVSKGYSAALPKPARSGIGRFFSNLGEPLNIVNNLFQGKFERALSSTYRFTVNSTVGVFGIFDIAKRYEVEKTPEDFGQTLAAWGVKPGPYLMLPFFGPSSLRDGVGFFTEAGVYFPNSIVTDSAAAATGLTVLNFVNRRADLLGADNVLDSQVDPYSFLKVAYEKDRINRLYDGNPPKTEEEDFDDF